MSGVDNKKKLSIQIDKNKLSALTPEEATNNGWDDLNSIHLECEGLSLVPYQVLPLLKDNVKIAMLGQADSDRLTVSSKSLLETIDAFRDSLNEIKAQHAGKTGSNTTPDELMFCLSVGEQYQNWMTCYQVSILPLVNEILEIFKTIEDQNNSTTVQ